MNCFRTTGTGILLGMALSATIAAGGAEAGETFTGTAAVKGPGGAAASAPITITIDRTLTQAETDKLVAAFKSGGAEALRKALTGVPPTGSVKLGGGAPAPARLTIERATDKGRLITIVTDKPLLFLGGSLPEAKAKAGYDFAVLDLELEASGSGSGSLAPAARITLKDGAFVVEDYASEPVRLSSVTRAK
jgi:hypothetical protein